MNGSDTLGNTYSITCEGTVGAFRPNVTWFYSNGSQVMEVPSINTYSSFLSSSTISILSFGPLSVFHAGEYICNASVHLEEDLMVSSNKSTYITVQSKLCYIIS